MHLIKMLERWAAPESPLQRRQATTSGGSTPSATSPATTATSAPQTTQQPTTRTTSTQAPPQTTERPTTSEAPPQTTENKPSETTAAPSASTPSTSNRPATSAQQSTSRPAATTAATTKSSGEVVTTVITPTATEIPTSTDPATGEVSTHSSSSSSGDRSGGLQGANGGEIAKNVGIAVGVVAGFAFIIIAIYLWRRHQRRKSMERLGSMEELARPPSPGPLGLGRSLTRGNGQRQPIDDDDDFLTPMDTLPNTHRMDDYGASKETATFYSDDKSVYATSIYQEDHFDVGHDNPSLPPMFPVAPPAAVTAANGRYYSGDFSNMRPKTPGSPTGGYGSNSNNNVAAIPSYSAMNKYTAYTPGAAVTTPAASERTQVYGNSSTSPVYDQGASSRPGGGYRSYDSHDAGGYV